MLAVLSVKQICFQRILIDSVGLLNKNDLRDYLEELWQYSSYEKRLCTSLIDARL